MTVLYDNKGQRVRVELASEGELILYVDDLNSIYLTLAAAQDVIEGLGVGITYMRRRNASEQGAEKSSTGQGDVPEK